MDFTSILTNFGFAAICLVGFAIAVWRALIWIGTRIALPVAERHVKFLDELGTAIALQSQALQAMAIQNGKNVDKLGEIMEGTERTLEVVQQTLAKVDEILRHVRGDK